MTSSRGETVEIIPLPSSGKTAVLTQLDILYIILPHHMLNILVLMFPHDDDHNINVHLYENKLDLLGALDIYSKQNMLGAMKYSDQIVEQILQYHRLILIHHT